MSVRPSISPSVRI